MGGLSFILFLRSFAVEAKAEKAASATLQPPKTASKKPQKRVESIHDTFTTTAALAQFLTARPSVAEDCGG